MQDQVKTDPSLGDLVATLSERYDPANADHTSALRQLWELAWPDTPWEGETGGSEISPQWTQLGFQRDDPASDLRGAGIAGVRHLTCFVRTYHLEYLSAIAAGPDHCVALASLNLTLLLRCFVSTAMLTAESNKCKSRVLMAAPDLRRHL